MICVIEVHQLVGGRERNLWSTSEAVSIVFCSRRLRSRRNKTVGRIDLSAFSGAYPERVGSLCYVFPSLSLSLSLPALTTCKTHPRTNHVKLFILSRHHVHKTSVLRISRGYYPPFFSTSFLSTANYRSDGTTPSSSHTQDPKTKGMTALASTVDTKPAASPLVAPCVRRLDGAFSPMSDDSMGGGGSGGGSSDGGMNTNMNMNNGNGRWKRELEPDDSEEQQPPPAKRVSPIPRRPQTPDASATTEIAAAVQNLGHAAGTAPMAPASSVRPWQSSPTCGLNGGTHAHAREHALAMGRAKSTSPSKAVAALAGAAAAVTPTSAASTRPGRASTVGADRPRSPPLLSEKPALSGEHQHPRPSSSMSASSPLTMVGHQHHCRDILKPSPAKQNVGGGVEGGIGARGAGKGRVDSDSPGSSCKGMKRPLGGGLRASTSWDGGSASNAPPGSGGGFSAPPAVCASCEGREPCSCSGGGDSRGAALRPPPPSTTTCLSPLPFARSISTESSGVGAGVGAELRRNLLGEDGFSDNPLSYSFSSTQSSPGVGPQLAGVGRSVSGGGSAGGGGGGGAGAGGGGGGHGEVDELAMLMGNDNMHDIQDCMRTLQASPTVSVLVVFPY